MTLGVLACSTDDIEIESTNNYTTGGIGTAFDKGAIEFNFNVPNYYDLANVRVVLHDKNNSERQVGGLGKKQIRFSNISPGDYDYTLEFWSYNNNDDAFVQYSFVNGNLVNVNSGSTHNYRNIFSNSFSINKTMTVRGNQTLRIEIDLN
ncbi:hypothetical protein [Aquimarina aquimarini]|uniref:hypothetical protein n=1 Tax=Aquimarina aquimarini TaxID=1191734 RepID=UPI00131F2C72|nr:hypothetical protein [Aquimarina aquimarini]